MTSVSVGNQRPRVEWIPEGIDHPDADAAVELAEAAGLLLDPWQEHVLRSSLRQRGRKWAAFEVGLVCPRQNGKNGLLEARELAGLFLLNERLIIHSAHQADTAKEAFRRLEELIDSNDWLAQEVRHVWRTNGHEAIELKNGNRIRFRTRTKGGGRGFSGDCVIFDEAMVLPEASQTAILPVVSARPNPQVWYTGSAVDQAIHEDGMVLASVRDRAIENEDVDSLAYFEWSLPYGTPVDVPDEVLADPDSWSQANPAFGIRITRDYLEKEFAAFHGNPRGFAVERLGVGDWPAIGGSSAVISLDEWAKLADPTSKPLDPVVFAFDATPDRAFATISASGARPDGFKHVEVVHRARGLGWLVRRLVELNETHHPAAIVTDGAGPAGSLIPELERAGLTVTPVSAPEYAEACGMFYDGVTEQTTRHLGTPELVAAIRGATQRPMGDRWAWSRRNSAVDISPLVACTLALWGHLTQEVAEPFMAVW